MVLATVEDKIAQVIIGHDWKSLLSAGVIPLTTAAAEVHVIGHRASRQRGVGRCRGSAYVVEHSGQRLRADTQAI